MNLLHAWKRFHKSAQDYGWRRALAKASGRLGLPLNKLFPSGGKGFPKDVSVIGCGQAAYATLCFFLRQQRGEVFLNCYDIGPEQAQKLQQAYGFEDVSESAEKLLQNPKLQTLFISSNHASHSDYAVAGLARGLRVFCEKPLATSFGQLEALARAIAGKEGLFHAGFNRPFAAATQKIADAIRGNQQPLSLHCIIHGHLLSQDHWYRKLEEGTRICGNMGHWIDLAVYLMHVRGVLPKQFFLTLRSAEKALPADDNVVLLITTDFGDLVSISLNARHEPFGGIEELISLQCGDCKATIDDFRNVRISNPSGEETVVFPRKDVGHGALVASVFEEGAGPRRTWTELHLSTLLTLHAAELAKSGKNETVCVERLKNL